MLTPYPPLWGELALIVAVVGWFYWCCRHDESEWLP
jgi:hypothetical protein